jgi:hypothetical protein
MNYDVQQKLDSGIELLTTDLSAMMDEGVEAAQHFRTDEPITIELGETAGHQVTVEAQHFIAAAVDREPDTQEIMMGMAEEGDTITEASVFISNDEAELGGGLERIEGGDLDDGFRAFETNYLDYERDNEWQSSASGFGDGPAVEVEKADEEEADADDDADDDVVGIGAPSH